MRDIQQKSFNWPHFPENGSIKRPAAIEKQLAVEDLLEFAFPTPDDI